MTLNELFARFDKLAAVRVLGRGGRGDCGGSKPDWQQPEGVGEIETAVRAMGLRWWWWGRARE